MRFLHSNSGSRKHYLSWALFAVLVTVSLTSDLPFAVGDEPEPKKDAAKPEDRYSFRKDHDPNGIGKFYMDREIAHVMGFAGMPWLERDEREEEEATSKLIESLQLKPGMVIADIGAGSGVISVLMAEKVAPTGEVLAVDVQQKMLDALKAKCTRLGIKNIKPVLGKTKSPQLPAEKVDLAIMVDVYHEFDFPYEMVQGISEAMKPGGRVVFVEYRKEDASVPIKRVHKMSEAQVKREIGLPEHQLKWTKTIDVLPWQHIIVFEKQKPKS